MTFLDDVLKTKQVEVAALRLVLPPRTLAARSGFREALAGPGLSVIAEIKRRSPSKGLLARDLDAERTARAYAEGGAAAISCLTDSTYFGARPDDLRRAATASLPVLRKDFLIDEIQIDESVAMGASAVLLIVRILEPDRLRALLKYVAACALDALVEVHDEAEIECALSAGASIIGVNNRDLDTLLVDSGRALALRARIPDGVVSVAESGVKTCDDVRKVQDAGFNAVLIGEALARSQDPAARLLELRGVSKQGRR
jgi:indole-3-glycerol phosphate synthase